MTTIGMNGQVEFRFFRPDAQEVRLRGDFDGWARGVAMQRDADGWWTARLTPPPGEYRFRYLADGTWYTDFASNGIEMSKHGWNSILLVQPSAAPAGDCATAVAQTTTMNREPARRVA